MTECILGDSSGGGGGGEEEVDKLRSRLDQQSNLICMLKQRADTTLKELSETSAKYEVVCRQLEGLQASLTQEVKQRTLVERRFHQLAGNHEEMVKLKDHYKQEARRVNKGEVHREREAEWQDRVRVVEGEWQEKVRVVEGEWQERVRMVEGARSEAVTKMKSYGETMNKIIKEHAGYIHKLKDQMKAVSEECDEKCLLKEKEILHLQHQLHQLQQTRDSDLQASRDESSLLKQELMDMKAREKERVKMLDKDVNIQTLKRKLEETTQKIGSLEKEYSAYKVHSGELLTCEKELNQQLRHLLI